MRIFIVLLLLFIAGCAPPLSEMQSLMDTQLEIERMRNDRLERIQQPPTKGYSDVEGVAYQVRMTAFQADEKQYRTDILSPMLDFSYKMARLPWDIGLGIWSSSNTGLLVCAIGVDCGGSGGGGDIVYKADNGSSISGISSISGNKSHHTRGDGNLSGYGSALAQDEGTAANRDGQNQFGNGVQGQAFTDPPNLQQTEGPTSVDSGTGISLP